jgi:DNA-binding MarR family transcriptional regulator
LYLDAGYLSRTLSWFEHQGLLTRVPTDSDARQRLLSLTSDGHQAHTHLAERFQQALADLLADLTTDDRQQVLNGLLTLHGVLAKSAAKR